MKLKDPRLEIFPAVIFPSGAYLHKKIGAECIYISKHEMYAFKDGSEVRINEEEFFSPLPKRFFYTINDGNFGLEKYEASFKLYKPPIKFTGENTFTNESVEETKDWIKQKLRNQGVSDSIFIVRWYNQGFNLKRKEIETKEMVGEKIFTLN